MPLLSRGADHKYTLCINARLRVVLAAQTGTSTDTDVLMMTRSVITVEINMPGRQDNAPRGVGSADCAGDRIISSLDVASERGLHIAMIQPGHVGTNRARRMTIDDTGNQKGLVLSELSIAAPPDFPHPTLTSLKMRFWSKRSIVPNRRTSTEGTRRSCSQR